MAFGESSFYNPKIYPKIEVAHEPAIEPKIIFPKPHRQEVAADVAQVVEEPTEEPLPPTPAFLHNLGPHQKLAAPIYAEDELEIPEAPALPQQRGPVALPPEGRRPVYEHPEFKKVFGMALASAFLSGHLGGKVTIDQLSANQTHEERVESLTSKTAQARIETPPLISTTREIPTGELEGKHMGSMGALYLGIEGRVDKHHSYTDKSGAVHYGAYKLPETLKVDFAATSRKIWAAKNHRFPNAHNKIVADYLDATYRKALSEGSEGKTTLAEKTNEANQVTEEIRTNLDWNTVGKLYGLSPAGTEALQLLASKINGNTLMAYSMTEIMSSGLDAATNAELYNTIFKEGGEEFVTRIAAMYDGQESFGPYQLTPYAIYEGPDKKAKPDRYGNYPTEYRGASKMNRALPSEEKIPNDILSLQHMRDHDKAAFLFALHNLANTIHTLSPLHEKTIVAPKGKMNATAAKVYREEIAQMMQHRQMLDHMQHMTPEELLEFISASHHLPAPSKTALISYLKNPNGTPFSGYVTNKALVKYTVDSRKNHSALVKELASVDSRKSAGGVG